MTRFASQRRAVSTLLVHAILEFTLVYVFMATRARPILKDKRQDLIGPSPRTRFVAVGARDSNVGAYQRVARLTMLRNCKCGTVPVQDGMAFFARVVVRGFCKLFVVLIFVTIRASGKLNLIYGVFPSREVALVALHLDMLPLQRVLGGVVLFHAEERRLPSLHLMAFLALALPGPRGELALVRIRRMANHALVEGQLFLEVAVLMAIYAGHLGVFSEQRVLGFGVVELKSRKNFFPSRGGMAVLATLGLERAFVGIDVAIDARVKLHVVIARRSAGFVRLVALFARHFLVLPGQRIASLVMVEILGFFPIHEVVAFQAVVSEPSFVNILVARNAILDEPKKRSGQILDLDERALFFHHVHRGVAFLARQTSVLAQQLVTRQVVVKFFLRRLPVNEIEVRSVVIQVALHAVLAVGIAHLEPVVVAVLVRQPFGDLLVAFQAFEGRNASAKEVATVALRRSGKRLMRLGKRSGGNLRAQRGWGAEESQRARQRQQSPQDDQSGKVVRPLHAIPRAA